MSQTSQNQAFEQRGLTRRQRRKLRKHGYTGKESNRTHVDSSNKTPLELVKDKKSACLVIPASKAAQELAQAQEKPSDAALDLRSSDCEEVTAVEEGAQSIPTSLIRSACKYEYLDHTADVQLHSWGSSLEEAFAQVTLAMFGYMTEMETVEVDPELTRTVTAKGHDMMSLLYNFMDEFLFVFCSEDMIFCDISVTQFDRKTFKMQAQGRGELFDLKKHPQGTEVKAITYSAMQIHEKDDGHSDIFVVIDI